MISGLLFEGNEAELLDLGLFRAVELVANAHVMGEVREVLGRPQFSLEVREVDDLLGVAREAVQGVPDPDPAALRQCEDRLSDKKDAPVWAGFDSSGARYLVTGDRELLKKVPGAIRTRDLLDRILSGET